jgi:hypothetical protein
VEAGALYSAPCFAPCFAPVFAVFGVINEHSQVTRRIEQMKLKYPYSNIDFVASPAYFIGCFDIYDREETLGEYLNQFNPNDKNQLEQILNEFIFNVPASAGLLIEHKAELIRSLEDALAENNFDFDSILVPDKDTDDRFTLPGSWSIEYPRVFFENIYCLAKKNWQ